VCVVMQSVNDEKLNFLAKVKVGDTKLKALQRLSPHGGILTDVNGLGLADDDVITEDGGPYTLTPKAAGTKMYCMRCTDTEM
jgi:hypothetical protein